VLCDWTIATRRLPLDSEELLKLLADRMRDKSTSMAEFVRLKKRDQEIAFAPAKRPPRRPRKSAEPVTQDSMEKPIASGEEASIDELVQQIEAETKLS
jgi:hypothetical protein